MRGDIEVEIEASSSSVSVQAVQGKNKKALTPLSEKAAAGSTMMQRVKGYDVLFKLVEIPANKVESATMVYLGNERGQDLLDAYAVSDLIPTFLEDGQLKPAYGRDTCGITEIADGSRRRFTAIETKQPLFVWVGNMTDEQMQYLSDVGNQYKGTSAWEKGTRYIRMLENHTQEEVTNFAGLKDRKTMMRYVATAKLPITLVRCFQSPNDLTARKGELLSKIWLNLNEDKQEEVIKFLENWIMPKKNENTPEYVIEQFALKCGGNAEKSKPEKPRELAMGATVAIKNGNATINIPKVSDESLKVIEDFISQTLSKEAVRDC